MLVFHSYQDLIKTRAKIVSYYQIILTAILSEQKKKFNFSLSPFFKDLALT